MAPRVNHVRHSGEYRLELGFTDGLRAVVDLKGWVLHRGGVFRPLVDIDYFSSVQLEPEAGTVVWPNGVDFCPDVLYRLATGEPINLPDPVQV